MSGFTRSPQTQPSSGLTPSGTEFPGDPAPGQLFHRTDLGATFSYDATRSAWEPLSDANSVGGLFDCEDGLAVGDLVFMVGDGSVAKCDPTDLTKMPAEGFVRSKLAADRADVIYTGDTNGFAGLTPRAVYFCGNDGRLSLTEPDGTDKIVQVVGRPRSTTVMVIRPEMMAIFGNP